MHQILLRLAHACESCSALSVILAHLLADQQPSRPVRISHRSLSQFPIFPGGPFAQCSSHSRMAFSSSGKSYRDGANSALAYKQSLYTRALFL